MAACAAWCYPLPSSSIEGLAHRAMRNGSGAVRTEPGWASKVSISTPICWDAPGRRTNSPLRIVEYRLGRCNESALAREFLDWQGPWLLQPQHFSVEQRGYLEQHAQQRPSEIAKCNRLYPKLTHEAHHGRACRGGTVRTERNDHRHRPRCIGGQCYFVPFYRE